MLDSLATPVNYPLSWSENSFLETASKSRSPVGQLRSPRTRFGTGRGPRITRNWPDAGACRRFWRKSLRCMKLQSTCERAAPSSNVSEWRNSWSRGTPSNLSGRRWESHMSSSLKTAYADRASLMLLGATPRSPDSRNPAGHRGNRWNPPPPRQWSTWAGRAFRLHTGVSARPLA